MWMKPIDSYGRLVTMIFEFAGKSLKLGLPKDSFWLWDVYNKRLENVISNMQCV